jgi:hypothetical protein
VNKGRHQGTCDQGHACQDHKHLDPELDQQVELFIGRLVLLGAPLLEFLQLSKQ